ncbi:MAG: hypothetical protein EOO07_14545 [Chitinophagaceae bacterium]|nr:MAG: hypothetical protein EOO07_14545 [Chitinophagaceae bacterium]
MRINHFIPASKFLGFAAITISMIACNNNTANKSDVTAVDTAVNSSPVDSFRVKAEAFAVFVKGTDVYACGYEINGGKSIAKLWKNGVATNLSDGTKDEVCKKVFAIDNDVYIAGYDNNGTTSKAKIWKNGVASVLTDATKYAELNAVFVK